MPSARSRSVVGHTHTVEPPSNATSASSTWIACTAVKPAPSAPGVVEQLRGRGAVRVDAGPVLRRLARSRACATERNALPPTERPPSCPSATPHGRCGSRPRPARPRPASSASTRSAHVVHAPIAEPQLRALERPADAALEVARVDEHDAQTGVSGGRDRPHGSSRSGRRIDGRPCRDARSGTPRPS